MNGSKTILLVEDNIADEELTLMAFKRNGITNPVVVARDGEEALDYMFGTGMYEGRDPSDLPQVIVLDLKLPRVSGLEVLRRIRDEDRIKCTPVVIMTSSKEEKDMVEAYHLGTNAYVRKPIDFNQFAEAVRYLGMFWLLLNECPNGCTNKV